MRVLRKTGASISPTAYSRCRKKPAGRICRQLPGNPTIGKLINDAMLAIEARTLPEKRPAKGNSNCPALDKIMLGEQPVTPAEVGAAAKTAAQLRFAVLVTSHEGR